MEKQLIESLLENSDDVLYEMSLFDQRISNNIK